MSTHSVNDAITSSWMELLLKVPVKLLELGAGETSLKILEHQAIVTQLF